ncbi:MAG: asparaginase [Vampirovibrio sp.]|nr:asparaginase [Vampirovibrio sp.]
MHPMLPWEPLLTIERAGLPERTQYGLLAVTGGKTADGAPLIQSGQLSTPLWSRSLLKPWQLLCMLPALKKAYPDLTHLHYAMMLSSHQADRLQVNLLEDIMKIAGITENQLQCPPSYSLSGARKQEMVSQDLPARPLLHPCSGKHLGVLLALKAEGRTTSAYLNKSNVLYTATKKLVMYLLEADSNTTKFLETPDGCGMPNYALTAKDLATLFYQLSWESPLHHLELPPESLKPAIACWPDLKAILEKQAPLIGGAGRLDTRLIQGDLSDRKDIKLLAKEGADGLLGVSVYPTPAFPEGLGILIKLAAGHDKDILETLIIEILEQLSLRREPREEASGLKTHVHFQIPIGEFV